jgi:hypothetical protein
MEKEPEMRNLTPEQVVAATKALIAVLGKPQHYTVDQYAHYVWLTWGAGRCPTDDKVEFGAKTTTSKTAKALAALGIPSEDKED